MEKMRPQGWQRAGEAWHATIRHHLAANIYGTSATTEFLIKISSLSQEEGLFEEC
jgi:hypothetical protein